MSAKLSLYFFAFNGLASLLLGAFGAHWAQHHLPLLFFHDYKTAVDYHYHYTLVLGIVSIMMLYINTKWLLFSYVLFTLGIVLFSGSLYSLALTQIKLFGVFTPIGGSCFILGWVTLLIAIKQFKNHVE